MLTRSLLPIIVVLAGCSASEPAPSPPAMRVPLHTDPPVPADAPRTSIGVVHAIDARAGTVTVAITTGARSEQLGLGRFEQLTASADQRAGLRVGEVIEFRYRPAQPRPQLLSVERHAHGAPVSLPPP